MRPPTSDAATGYPSGDADLDRRRVVRGDRVGQRYAAGGEGPGDGFPWRGCSAPPAGDSRPGMPRGGLPLAVSPWPGTGGDVPMLPSAQEATGWADEGARPDPQPMAPVGCDRAASLWTTTCSPRPPSPAGRTRGRAGLVGGGTVDGWCLDTTPHQALSFPASARRRGRHHLCTRWCTRLRRDSGAPDGRRGRGLGTALATVGLDSWASPPHRA